MSDWDQLVEVFKTRVSWVAFTGAGISAESGIPTYRGTGGALWSKYDPNIYASVSGFMNDPTYYWSFFRDERYPILQSAEPNAAHHTLAEWEAAGKVGCVITQNIDGLHGAAGSQDVIELHGNTRRFYCLECEKEYSYEDAYRMLTQQMPPPCEECSGRIRPDVVFFGETLPQGALERAYRETERCDLMLAVGSSLGVYPAADIPQQALANGAALVIINRDPTPLDGIASAVIREPAGEVLPKLAEELR